MPTLEVISLRQPAHIGESLRARRERRGHSLPDMAVLTHVREDYLSAIERLDEAGLPAIGYTLGYVRTYAQALGLNGDRTVAEFKRDLAVADGLPLRDAPHFILRRQWRLPRGFLPAISVVGIATMLGTWYGVQTAALAETAPNPSVLPQQAKATPTTPLLAEGLLTLRTTAPSWVQIKDADGTTLISRIFVTGETWQGPVGGDYSVSVRDAGAVELYNGADLIGALGARGEPLTDHILTIGEG